MTRMFRILTFASILALAGCGGDSSPTNPGGGGDDATFTMTAVIDGVAWTAVTASASVADGFVAVGSSDVDGATGIGLGFEDDGTGAHPIGVGLIPSASITTHDGAGWQASWDRGSGSIIVTSRTADRIAGTFSFTAELFTGSGTPETRVVTDGVFDLPILE